jgi:hypothetical protein
MRFPNLVFKGKSVNPVPRYLNFSTINSAKSIFFWKPWKFLFLTERRVVWAQISGLNPSNRSLESHQKLHQNFPPPIKPKKKNFSHSPEKNLINFSQFKKMIVKVFPFPKPKKKFITTNLFFFAKGVETKKKLVFFILM